MIEYEFQSILIQEIRVNKLRTKCTADVRTCTVHVHECTYKKNSLVHRATVPLSHLNNSQFYYEIFSS